MALTLADTSPPPSRSGGRLLRLVLAGTGVLTMLAALLGSVPAQAAAPSYVALGDSYSSGVGTREYINDGTNCKRSVYAYPELAAKQVGATLTFQACSGARTSDVLGNQLGPLSAGTGYVTISVGGNDAGFADVITKCALPAPYDCTGDITSAENFMRGTLPGRLDQVYSAIRSHAPKAKVVVVGYPHLFNGKTCNAAARISAKEEGQLNGAADVLAGVIGDRAAAAGFTFVDPRSAFTGHAICDGAEWLNGLSNPVEESYHPNRNGHVGYTNLVAPKL